MIITVIIIRNLTQKKNGLQYMKPVQVKIFIYMYIKVSNDIKMTAQQL